MNPPIVLFLLALFSSLGLAHASPSDNFSQIEAFVQQAKTATGSVSGTSVVLIREGKVVKGIYAGLADVENDKKVDEDTVFYFASTTKALMAFAVLLAEQQGKINQATTLADLFPDIQFQYIDPNRYTMKDLLTHTAGLKHEAMTWTFSYTGLHDEEKRKQFVATLRPDPQASKGQFNYTNLGYNLFAIWFDRQYPQGWQQALQQLIFKPLALNRITADVDQARQDNWPIAKPYSYKYAGGTQSIYMNKNNQTLYSVGVFARPLDVAGFLMALMSQNKSGSPFNQAVIKESQRQLVGEIDSYFAGYGWGWMFNKYEGMDMLLHTGGFDGASVQISYIPEKDMGVIVVHNESGIVANELNGTITTLAYKAMLGKDDSANYQTAEKEMAEIADFVKRSQQKIANKHAELSMRTGKSQPLLHAIQGRYVNDLAGEIEISMKEGRLRAKWGDLESIVYAGESEDSLVLEWRPGKFYVANIVRSEGVEQLHHKDWVFTRK